METKNIASFAFLLSLNLLLFSLVSATRPTPDIPGSTTSTYYSAGKCDPLNLGVCANVLNLVDIVVGSPPTLPCCSLIEGLVDLEAAVCLCTAIRANILGIDLNVPISLSLVLNNCGKEVPTEFFFFTLLGGGLSIGKNALNAGSSSRTPSVYEVSEPRRGAKFESNKSFNHPSLYSKSPLDFDRLAKHCVFSDGYVVFSPSPREPLFDKKEGCRKLVESPRSNSGWHDKWARYEGPGLNRIGPWQSLCSARVRSLNRLGSKTPKDLSHFLGSSVRYQPEEFIDPNFLASHCFSGPSLRRLFDWFVKMPIGEFLARLVRSKASGASVVVVGPEEKGPEVNSKAVPIAEADDLSDLTPIAVLLKDKDKKRHHEGHSSRGHHSNKLKDSVICKASVVASVGQDGPSSMARDVSSAGGSVDSLKTGLHRCKAHAEKVL
ncbi:hypothetical protein AgCh_028091 [Apium graveolens]